MSISNLLQYGETVNFARRLKLAVFSALDSQHTVVPLLRHPSP